MLPDQLSCDDVTEAVLTVLREELANPALDLTDDFYAAGGHSLMIASIARRLRSEYSLQLNLRQFAVNTQIAAIANACQVVSVEGESPVA
jgi:acyl carrier protein